MNKVKERELSKADDTHYNVSWHNFENIVTDLGFELMIKLPFEADCGEYQYCVWFHPDGALIMADSWRTASGGSKVNSANMTFNVKITDEKFWLIPASSSPVGEPQHRSCNLNVVEGLRHKWKLLRESTTLLNPWIEPYGPFWLDHHGDSQGLDYTERDEQAKRVTAERLLLLPDHVRACIGR